MVGIKLDDNLDEDFEIFYDDDYNFYTVMFGSCAWVDYMCDLEKYLEIENFYVNVMDDDFSTKYDKITQKVIENGFLHYKKLKKVRESMEMKINLKKMAKSKPQPQDSGENIFTFNSSVPLPDSSTIDVEKMSIPSLEVPPEKIVIPITKENLVSYPSLDVVDNVCVDEVYFDVIFVADDLFHDIGVCIDDDIDATQDRVCKSIIVFQSDDIEKVDVSKIPQVEIDIVKNLKVDISENGEHTQVGVMHIEVEIDVDIMEDVEHAQVGVLQVKDIVEVTEVEVDKHTQDGVLQVVPTQVGVDENFIDNGGEQEVLSVNEQSTHPTAIKDIDNKVNKENEEVQANFKNNKDKIDKEIEYKINRDKIFFKRACNKIINSLKKLYVQKYFNCVDGCDHKFVKNTYGSVVENLEIFNVVNGKAGTFCDAVDNIGNLVLDDGRLRPRDCFYGVDVHCNDGSVWLQDDGRLIPRRFCNDVISDMTDGRKWCFHDGG